VSEPATRPAPGAIRDSLPADLPAIAAIYAHYVATSLATFDEIAPSAEDMGQRRAQLVAAGLPFVVAANGAGRIEGYAYAAPFRPRSGYRFSLEDSIYVEPAASRRGIGTALLATLIERCAASGYRQLVAVIGDTANAGSIALHEKLGFAHVGLMPAIGFKLGHWVDGVLMQRPLGAGATSPPQR